MTDQHPTAEQVHAYMGSTGWTERKHGVMAASWSNGTTSVRILHELGEIDIAQLIVELSIAEERHPGDVHEAIAKTAVGAASVCTDFAFCNRAGGCDECQPETWRTIHAGLDPWRLASLHGGASAEDARWAVRHMSDLYREIAEELNRSCTSGWRLYEVDGESGIRLVNGRAKT